VLTAVLSNTGQNQATLTIILIVGAVLVILGVAASVAVRISRKKNASAAVYKPDASGEQTTPADESK
jgi:flagellar basal body-associated protein FliL